MQKVKQINIVKEYTRKIEKEKILDTLYSYYKDTKTEKIINKDTGKENVSAHITYGATLDKYIDDIIDLSPIKTVVPATKMYEGCATIEIIKKSDLEKIQRGEVHVTDILYKSKHQIKPIKDDEILILWNSGSHKIADLHGNFIPIPINIGYINGSLDNKTYDLGKVLKLLKNDEHVLNRESLEITHIPYYNCFDGRNHSIEFKYLPSYEDYQKLMDINCSLDIPYYIIDELIGAKIYKKEDDD